MRPSFTLAQSTTRLRPMDPLQSCRAAAGLGSPAVDSLCKWMCMYGI